MEVVQAKLRKGDQIQTAWIETKAGLKVGCSVELKEDNNALWVVEELYSKMDSKNINHGWHVGGL